MNRSREQEDTQTTISCSMFYDCLRLDAFVLDLRVLKSTAVSIVKLVFYNDF